MKNFLKRFAKDESGVVYILFAFLATVFVILIALNVDLGRAFMAKTAISAAVDASALAAGNQNGTVDDVRPYFLANLSPGQYDTDFSFEQNISPLLLSDGRNIEVDANNIEMPYYFGFKNPETGEASDKIASISDRGQIQRANSDPSLIDYYLIVDTSGSLDRYDYVEEGTSKTSDITRKDQVKKAIRDMVNRLSEFDNSDRNFTLSLISYGTDLTASFANITNMAYYSDDRIDELLRSNYLTCGACGLSELNDVIQNNSREGALKVVVFMTDGYFNFIEGKNYYEGLSWPLKKVDNQCFNLCDGTDNRSLTLDEWRNKPLNRFNDPSLPTPVYDAARKGGEFDIACDNPTLADRPYPQTRVEYPSDYAGIKDMCMIPYAEVLNRCNTLKGLVPKDKLQIYTVRFGYLFSEGYTSTAFADDITRDTMTYCATKPENSLVAVNGVDFTAILIDIVNRSSSLRIVR